MYEDPVPFVCDTFSAKAIGVVSVAALRRSELHCT